jgi:hypothetical protein
VGDLSLRPHPLLFELRGLFCPRAASRLFRHSAFSGSWATSGLSTSDAERQRTRAPSTSPSPKRRSPNGKLNNDRDTDRLGCRDGEPRPARGCGCHWSTTHAWLIRDFGATFLMGRKDPHWLSPASNSGGARGVPYGGFDSEDVFDFSNPADVEEYEKLYPPVKRTQTKRPGRGGPDCREGNN